MEDRTDSLHIWGGAEAERRLRRRPPRLGEDVHSLTASVVRDGAVSSGDYDVKDGGRGHAIQEDRGLEHVTLRLTLPVGYEAQL